MKVKSESVSHSVVSGCNPVRCSPSGSSVQGVLQARMLEEVTMPSFRVSPQARVSCFAGRFFTVCVYLSIYLLTCLMRRQKIYKGRRVGKLESWGFTKQGWGYRGRRWWERKGNRVSWPQRDWIRPWPGRQEFSTNLPFLYRFPFNSCLNLVFMCWHHHSLLWANHPGLSWLSVHFL